MGCSKMRNMLLILSLVLLPFSGLAATVQVNTFDDIINDDGLCSLREAVIATNTNSSSGSSEGECIAGESSAVDEIVLPEGAYYLTIGPEASIPADGIVGEYTLEWSGSAYEMTVTPDAALGDLDITESVIVTGLDSGATIDGGWRPLNDITDLTVEPDSSEAGFGDRIFHIIAQEVETVEAEEADGEEEEEEDSASVDVSMSNLTLLGGYLNIVELPDVGDSSWSLRRNGGGLAVNTAASVYDPTTSGSEDEHGGAGGSEGEEGATYTLTLNQVTVATNYAGDGAGVYSAAELTATLLTVTNNRATANGGGLYNDAVATISSSTFSNNGAEGGAGIFDTGSHLTTIDSSTISGNAAVGGGGISSRSNVIINMTNCTVSGNESSDVGGGIYTNGSVNIDSSTIVDNYSGSDASFGGAGINIFPSGGVFVTVRNSILANNLKGESTVDASCGKTGGSMSNISSYGNNIDAGSTCLFGQSSDHSNTDPLLETLADNGGPTLTHMPLYTSPALDAIVGDCTTADQRGFTRPQGALCDIGAVEIAVVCGDGVVQDFAGEECDDGNTDNTDSCTNSCLNASCGDGFVQVDVEVCDDGNLDNTDSCTNTCTEALCGDGFVQSGVEACDDGNQINGDGCQANCALPVCADGILDPNEACDDGNQINGDGCQANCALPGCGDVILDIGEECDDGNHISGDGCQLDCLLPQCGDGVLDAGEQCDDGNNGDGDGCHLNCLLPACGDGIIDSGEECDDGNISSGDGCSVACSIETTDDTSDTSEDTSGDINTTPDGSSSADSDNATSGGGGCSLSNNGAPQNRTTLLGYVFAIQALLLMGLRNRVRRNAE